MSLNPAPPPTPSSLAVRRGRAATPLSVAAKESPRPTFEFDDSLLQVSTPALSMGMPSPGHPPKVAASPRLPPPQAQAARPTLRQARSFTNAKPTHKSSFLDLFSSKSKASSKEKDKDKQRKETSEPAPPPRKSLGSRPKPPVIDDLPSLPSHLKPVVAPVAQDPVERTTEQNNVKSNAGMDLVSALKDMEPSASPASQQHQIASAEWTPPTLAQAYPQAVIHAALEDPDSYRASSRGSKLRPTTPSARAAPSRPTTGYKKPSKAQRRPSDMGGDVPMQDNASVEDGIPRKIYVLISAGYVLEYAGTGSPDRLPERTLKLGSFSAAYACDAIPGKHWVVQVVQNANDTSANQPLAPKKSFVQRMLKTNAAPKRKSARRFLLILEGPTLMNQWILSVRNEISRFDGKTPQRPATAIRQIETDEASKPEVTLTQPSEDTVGSRKDAIPTKPPSPETIKPIPAADTVTSSSSPPRALATLPNSPTTLVGSERLSRADTAVGSNMSSSRSSRAVGKGLDASKHATNLASPIPEQSAHEISSASLEEAPLTDEDRELESATTHSHASLSFDSSAGASHTSTEKTTPLDAESSDIGSNFSSPSQNFFTPLTTPMSWTFPKDQKRLSTYASASASPVQDQGEPLVSPAVLSARSSSTHGLRQSASAPRLAANTPTTMETIRESTTPYFSRRNPKPLPEDVEDPPRSPMGNAFAQAAERRERSHSRGLSSSTHSASNNSSSRTSTVALQTSPRGTPYQSQPSSKRTSVIHANGPLPLRTSQTYDSLSTRAAQDSESGYGVDLRNVHTKGENDTRESVLMQLSNSSEGRAGENASPQQPRLRRPSSLRVKTDVRPPVAGARAVQPSSQGSTPNSAVERTRSPPHSGRSSTLVPVVRPPSVRPSMRSSRQIRLGAAAPPGPPSAPPTVPLPPPPVQQTPLTF